MWLRKTVVAVVLALTIAAGCSRGTVTGPNPTPPRPPGGVSSAPLPPIYADIALRSASRASGATLRLRDCGVERGRSAGQEFCTEDLELTFAVAADRDLGSVALRVSFVLDGRRCAVAVTSPAFLSAHFATELRATTTDYHLQDEAAPRSDLGCARPPTATTTMVVELLDYSEEPDGISVVRTEFAHGYRFVMQ